MGTKFSSMDPSELRNEAGKPTLSIFGYGSLLWNPGFSYDHQRKAVLRGYSRRFYQGNTNYRGTKERPGRVVTLVEEAKSRTYGIVYTIVGRRKIFAALEHLYEREIETGYYFEMVNAEFLDDSGEICRALTFIASPANIWFLGPPTRPNGSSSTVAGKVRIRNSGADDDDEYDEDDDAEIRKIASEIARARGHAGPNCEYLFKLADSVRKLFPGFVDKNLFRLEANVMTMLGMVVGQTASELQ